MRVIEYRDYLARRSAAKRINSKMPAEYPCRTCTTGLCCQHPTVWVTLGDAKFILDGIKDREIPSSAKQKALKQAAEPSIRHCAFYNPNKDNHCLIYNHRPITCMIYGFGAIPLSEASSTRTVFTSAILGKDLGIPLSETKNAYMCGNCHEFIAHGIGRIPIEDVINVNSQRFYVNDQPFPELKLGMKEFVLAVLANERFSRETLKSNSFPRLRRGDVLKIHEKSHNPQAK